jgi:UDP-N-acetyl-2-amino-2-deoxyglucuronate dehydrogenase
MTNFALIGAAGYIAPRHLKAIRDTGNKLIAAVDPHDSVGLLDQFSFETRFFTEIERFDRHLEKLRRGPDAESNRAHWVSICSPNYLHDAHCRLALRIGADVICEKPLVVNPWNLDQLEQIEEESGHKIYNVLQLRVHPGLVQLKADLQSASKFEMHDVVLTYITSRGAWYHTSWKGDQNKSGGVATNIGIHFFDLLMWLFGPAGEVKVFHNDPKRMSGFIELENARVRWYLSMDHNDLPPEALEKGKMTYRSITVDGQEIEFSEGFGDLHTKIYENTLAGNGFTIADARPSITLVHRIRTTPLTEPNDLAHPLLKK